MIYKNINDFLQNEIDLKNELICEIKLQTTFENYDEFYILTKVFEKNGDINYYSYVVKCSKFY